MANHPAVSQTDGVPTEYSRGARAEGYDHIGDPTWNPGEGGAAPAAARVIHAGVGNTCGTGAFGVADPATLAFATT